MSFKRLFLCMALIGCVLSLKANVATVQPENLDRGLVAVTLENHSVYLGWRLLVDDPLGVAFNVYRVTDGKKSVKLNDQPITGSTNFTDSQADSTKQNAWYVVPVVKGKEQKSDELKANAVQAWKEPYQSFKMQGDYSPNKVGVGDLNGDGVYDLIIKQPSGSIDPGSIRMSQDTYKFEAYDGKTGAFMWRYDLGWNMDMGIWFTPAVVFDLDGDGKAEIAMKASEYAATVEESFVEQNSFVLKGPEYCLVLDGETGKEIARADWITRGDPTSWGDPRGNRVNRNQIGVAYLDGMTPSLLVCRGTYTKMLIDAYKLVDKKLVKQWSWNGDNENPQVRGQGSHGMHVLDVDNDGKDEILFGDAALDDNGKLLWNMNMGHPDVFYVADIDPDRQGLEIFYGFEDAQSKNGFCTVDPATGKILWGNDNATKHLHDWGMIGDIIPSEPGLEMYALEKDLSQAFLYGAKGKLISDGKEFGGVHTARTLYWLDGPTKVYYPFNYRLNGNPLTVYGGEVVGGFPGQIVAIADLYGDWREEVVTVLDGEVRIYTTTILSTSRRVCLMQDHLYRMDVSMVTMGYFYVPQLGRAWSSER